MRTVKRTYQIDTGGRLKLTAAFISDVHERCPDRLIEIIREISPEVIFIGGDLIEAKKPKTRNIISGSDNAYRFLREAAELAPVYYAFGNHETYISDGKKLRAVNTGARLLENGFDVVKTRGGEFAVGAVAPKRSPDAWIGDFEARREYKILICHEPDRYINELRHVGADIVLSGHAHGGQWRFFGRGVYSPGQGLFPRYTRGLHGRMLVSAGASNHTPIPRINNPCEVIELQFQ